MIKTVKFVHWGKENHHGSCQTIPCSSGCLCDAGRVVVASEGLLDSEAITIKDIVAGQTGISFDKIKIVEAK